jgi:hypothetical protein
MAREESSREDLLGEATALVERIELAPHDSAEPHLIAGFRADGALSIFFGEDPVYHFNAAGELRRAYCDGKLVKANRRQLITLERARTPGEVQLIRHELSAAEQGEFLSRMATQLGQLKASLETNAFAVIGQVPAGADVLGRLRSWLAAHRDSSVSVRPNL